MSELSRDFSLAVINARKRKGLTQEAAADLLDISRSCLQSLESAAHVPSFPVAVKISKILDIDITVFYDRVVEEGKRRKDEKGAV